MSETRKRPAPSLAVQHEVLAVVFQIRAATLSVLLWQRAREPFATRWALPGGALNRDEDLGPSVRRQLAEKVDVRELNHLEQLETVGDPQRHPEVRVLATSYLGLVPADADPVLPQDTAWQAVARLPRMAFDHDSIVAAGVRRLQAKLSYTNIGFALAPPTFTMSALAGYYRAALGYAVRPTNLQRILTRRGQIEATDATTSPGSTGGRPAVLYRFTSTRLDVTDPFAVLAPPPI